MCGKSADDQKMRSPIEKKKKERKDFVDPCSCREEVGVDEVKKIDEIFFGSDDETLSTALNLATPTPTPAPRQTTRTGVQYLRASSPGCQAAKL